MRLMKLCQIVLRNLKQFPEDYLTKIYYEEKYKWIMEQVHTYKNTPELEAVLGDEVEILLVILNREKMYLDQLYISKGWEDEKEADEDEELYYQTQIMTPEEY